MTVSSRGPHLVAKSFHLFLPRQCLPEDLVWCFEGRSNILHRLKSPQKVWTKKTSIEQTTPHNYEASYNGDYGRANNRSVLVNDTFIKE